MPQSFDKLALHGGPPVFPDGPPPWPPESSAVREALASVYASGDWGRYDGSHCDSLRRQMQALLAVKHVQLCCSGTFAVELALRALQVGSGQEVILAGYDFGGNFRVVEDVGALPVLADLAAGSWVLDPEEVEKAITPQTRAIVASHLHGSFADMIRLREIADQHGIGLVEDACQAHGATVQGKAAGTHGHIGIWSFGGSKLLTAGRGGAIFTNDDTLAQRAKVYCERANNAFPLSELQAAVIVPQLESLAEDTRRRAKSVDAIRTALVRNEFVSVADAAAELPAYYKLGLWFHGEGSENVSIDTFVSAAAAEGIDIGPGFRGFHRRPESRCRKVGLLPNAARAAKSTIVLHHPVLLSGEETARSVAHALDKVSCWLAKPT